MKASITFRKKDNKDKVVSITIVGDAELIEAIIKLLQDSGLDIA